MEEKVRCERNSRLLIVEDDESQLRTLTAIMQGEGFDVIGCSTTAEAIEHLKHLDTGVVVLDLRLPDLSGTQLLERLADATDKIRVIINTAYSSYESAKDALNLGAFAYVEKAGDPDELLRYVHRAFQASLRSYADELETAVAERTHDLLQANESLKTEITERKKAEEAMRESEQKYRALVEQSLQGIIILQGFQIVFANPTAAKIAGLTVDEVLALTPEDIKAFIPAEERAAILQGYEERLVDKPVEHNYELRLVRKNGEEFWLDVFVSRIEYLGKSAIQVAFIDITERKRAEEALRQSEEKFRSIFDNANDIIASVTKTGKILEVNKKIEDILGYKPDELIGKNFMTLGLLAAKNAARMFHFFKESVKIGGFLVSRDGRNVTEVWVNHKDGHTVLLEANTTTIKEDGKLVGYLSVIRDITERKKAEEAYRSLVDHSLQGLAILQDERVVFTNQALADIAGYTVEEMLAMSPEKVQAFVHPDDRPLVWSRHRGRLNGEELPERYEFRGIRKDGSTCWLELHASRIEYQGKPAIQVAYVDITERKKTVEALRYSRDYLEKLTNSMWDAVFSVKMPERVIEWANDSFRLIGYEPEECIGKTTEFLYPDDSEFLDFGNKLKCAMAAGKDVLHAEQILKRKNGETFPAEITNTFFREKGEIVRVTSIVRDVSERKKAEDVIAKLAKFPDEDPYPVLRISGHGMVIYANKASLPLLKVWRCRVGQSLPDPWHELVMDVLSSGQSQQTEAECEGRIFSLTFAPVVDANYVNVYGLDITERKKAEDELRLYSEITVNMSEGVYAIRASDSIIVYTNPKFEQMFRYGPGELIGKHVSVINAPTEKSPQETSKEIIDVLNKKGVWHGEILNIKKDGTPFWCYAGVSTFEHTEHQKVWVTMHTDITERKKAEERLLEHQSKLKAMASEMLLTEERERQRLAVGLHDEVCQKLVLTKLALESSLNLVSDSKVLASLRIVCEGIGETIEQADSLTFELSNPVLHQLGFVIALEKYLTEEIRQKYGIEYELEGDEQLSTFPDEIKNCLFRVTRELLTNVVKHAQARKVKVSARESQGQIYVRVQDDGVGFEESQAGSKVSQTARFGLFSIREQLEYLGGHLEIESEPGRGTKATVTVPLTKKAIVYMPRRYE